MVQKIKLVSRQLALSATALAMVLGLSVFVAPPANAATRDCRVFNAVSDGYEAGAHRTPLLTVPNASQSECRDINVRNIAKSPVDGKYCSTYRVQFFPTWGPDYYTPNRTVCSQDPDGAGPKNGPSMPIATNVINGTKYRIWQNIQELGVPMRAYQIVD